MKIQYLGHSSFLLAWKDTRIVTDPYGDVGFSFPHVRADGVTVSHGHYDHCNTDGVEAPLLFDRAGSYRLGAVRLNAIPSFHDDAGGARRGKNLIFRFEGEGITVCHLGDLGERCGEETAERIGHTDVLLIPVGGNYTIGAEEAAKLVGLLRPSVVIPMHYHVPGLTVDIAGPEAFLSRFENVVRLNASSLEVTADALAGDTKIILMERK